MRRLNDDIRDIRVPSEALARWALETPLAAQEATGAALAFLTAADHAGATLLPVATVIRSEKATLDPDGFLRQPRGAVEHFRQRALRATAWMDAFIFFRERFPAPASRQPPDALYSMAQLLLAHGDDEEAAVDTLVRECVMAEIEDLLARTLTYPPLQLQLQRLRDNEAQRSADARRLAAAVLGDVSGAKLSKVRTRMVASGTRALLAARPLLDELERGGFAIDRKRAAKGFGRRLEEAVSELPGAPLLESILQQISAE